MQLITHGLSVSIGRSGSTNLLLLPVTVAKVINERRGRLEEVFDFDKPIEEDPITAAAVHLSGKGFGKPDDVIRRVGKPQREQRLLVDLLL